MSEKVDLSCLSGLNDLKGMVQLKLPQRLSELGPLSAEEQQIISDSNAITASIRMKMGETPVVTVGGMEIKTGSGGQVVSPQSQLETSLEGLTARMIGMTRVMDASLNACGITRVPGQYMLDTSNMKKLSPEEATVLREAITGLDGMTRKEMNNHSELSEQRTYPTLHSGPN